MALRSMCALGTHTRGHAAPRPACVITGCACVHARCAMCMCMRDVPQVLRSLPPPPPPLHAHSSSATPAPHDGHGAHGALHRRESQSNAAFASGHSTAGRSLGLEHSTHSTLHHTSHSQADAHRAPGTAASQHLRSLRELSSRVGRAAQRSAASRLADLATAQSSSTAHSLGGTPHHHHHGGMQASGTLGRSGARSAAQRGLAPLAHHHHHHGTSMDERAQGITSSSSHDHPNKLVLAPELVAAQQRHLASVVEAHVVSPRMRACGRVRGWAGGHTCIAA